MVHGLALQLRGKLALARLDEGGTSIDLWLPAARYPFRAAIDPIPAGPLVAATGVVLLVEDDEIVRVNTTDMR